MNDKKTGARAPHPAESKEICSKCVNEEFLRQTIRESGVDGQCSYCSDPGRTLAIGEVCILGRADALVG
jgi:hypothetical protein